MLIMGTAASSPHLQEPLRVYVYRDTKACNVHRRESGGNQIFILSNLHSVKSDLWLILSHKQCYIHIYY